jgi:hypothetical protein
MNPVGTGEVLHVPEPPQNKTFAFRAAASTSLFGTGVAEVFITCTAVATIACTLFGATTVINIATSANAPAVIKLRLKNCISFLLSRCELLFRKSPASWGCSS